MCSNKITSILTQFKTEKERKKKGNCHDAVCKTIEVIALFLSGWLTRLSLQCEASFEQSV